MVEMAEMFEMAFYLGQTKLKATRQNSVHVLRRATQTKVAMISHLKQ